MLYMNSAGGVLGEIRVRPLGQGQDDAPRLRQAAVDIAGQAALTLLPGLAGEPWLIKSRWDIPNGTVIRGTESTRIIQQLPSVGDPRDAGLLAVGVYGALTTLAADPALGSNTVSTEVEAGSVVQAGDWIIIKRAATAGFRGALYRALAVSGSGPYTITLDRPLSFVFKAGDDVNVMPRIVRGIRIEGNGMTMSGTGARYVELIHGVTDCHVSNIRFDPLDGSVSERLLSFDIASFNNCAEGLVGDGGGVTTIGYSVEAGEQCRLSDSWVRDCLNPGILIQDSANCTVARCQAYSCGSGLSLIAALDEGSNNNRVELCTFASNEIGILFEDGSSENTIADTTIRGNVVDGVRFVEEAGTFVYSRNTFDNVHCSGNGVVGFRIGKQCVDTVLSECTIQSGVVSVEVEAGSFGTKLIRGTVEALVKIGQDNPPGTRPATCYMEGVKGNGANIVVGVGGTASLTGCTFKVPDQASFTNVILVEGGRAAIRECLLDVGLNCCGVTVLGGVASVDALTVTGAAPTGRVGLLAEGGTIRMGARVNLEGVASPISGNGYFSRGTFVTANGNGSPQRFTWPNLMATDRIVLRRVATGGVPSTSTPAYSILPNIGADITFSGGDTSTYEVIIL